MKQEEIQEKVRIVICDHLNPWWYDMRDAYNDALASWKYGDLVCNLRANKKLSLKDLKQLVPLYRYAMQKIPLKIIKERQLEETEVLFSMFDLNFDKEEVGKEVSDFICS